MDFQTEMQSYYYGNAYSNTMNPSSYTSGNIHVINATYHLIVKKLGLIFTTDDVYNYRNFTKACKNQYGWYDRTPVNHSPERQDDTIGLAVSSNITNVKQPIYDIYATGSHWNYGLVQVWKLKFPVFWKWYFINQPESIMSLDNWFGRFFWLPGIYKVAVGNTLSWFDKLSYTVYLLNDIYFNKDHTSTSVRILQWLSNDLIKGQSKLTDWAINKWEDNIKKIYPGQMGEVFGIYYGNEHPFSKYMLGKI